MKPILTLLFTLTALHAQTGHWDGVIQLPASEIPIQVDLARDAAGGLYGSFSSPPQHIQDMPLSDLGTKGSDVFFQIKGTPGNRTFIGGLSPDNKSMSGEFKQGPYSLRFVLSRSGEAKIAPVQKLSTVSKELEGDWNGTAEVSGQQLLFVLSLANQTDGTATGTIHSLEDDLHIPISGLKQTSSNIALDLHAVGGSFAGSLNGTELTGTYTQGDTALPITFRRASK